MGSPEIPEELVWLDEMKPGMVLVAIKDWDMYSILPAWEKLIPGTFTREQFMKVHETTKQLIVIEANDCLMYFSYRIEGSFLGVGERSEISVMVLRDEREYMLHIGIDDFLDVFEKLESS